MVFMVVALAAWWYAVPQMARMIHAGTDAPDPRAEVRGAAVATWINLARSVHLGDVDNDAHLVVPMSECE